MRKFFTLCMVGALALTACSDDDDNKSGNKGTITIGTETKSVESAFSGVIEPLDGEEGGYVLVLLDENYPELPTSKPDFFVVLYIAESCLDKQIDLTKVLSKSGPLTPYILISDMTYDVEINDENTYTTPEGLTVSSGTLKATRSGDKFTVKFTVSLSDGHTIAADWSGSTKIVTRLDS